MTKEQTYFIEIGDQIENALQGNLFGKPCFKIGKKAFVCFFQNEMVFKLSGENHGDALSLDGAKLFDPSGKNRPMKGWVQVPYHYKDSWLEFAKAAFDYVSG
ncbi:MAG: hypothetical protein V3U80_06795 [Flavobacteriaceae bacterium]